MKNNEKFELILKYITVLLISFITLIAGVILGYYITKKQILDIGISENKINANIFELETTIKFLEENTCDDKLLKDFGVDLDKVGEELEKLQYKPFVSEKELQYLKNFYYALELNHYFLLKKAEEKCNKKFFFIFYFYKPIEECKECYAEGLYLSVLKLKNPDLVEIYSFNMDDFNKSILLKKLMLKYNLTKESKAPVLIINGKKYGFLNLDQLETLLKKFESSQFGK